MVTFPKEWWTHKPLIFAHRGASKCAPENTLPAFQTAIDVGADGVELDVRLSADHVPVVIHNVEVDHTTNGSGSVYDLSVEEIKRLDAGSWFDQAYKNVVIPTLEEVLDAIGNKILINIELKASRKENMLVEKVCELIEKMDVSRSVWFSCFNHRYLRKARKILPTIPNGYLFAVRTLLQRIHEKSTPIEAVHPYFRIVTQRYVEHLHQRNKRVAVWTVDDVDTALKLKEINVDAIITNDPGALIDQLR